MGGMAGTGKKINAKSKVNLHLAQAIQATENYIQDLKSEIRTPLYRQRKIDQVRNFQEKLKDLAINFVENF